MSVPDPILTRKSGRLGLYTPFALLILAAIAYADALTAKRANVVNAEDHNAAPRLLRDVLKQVLPETHEKRFIDTLRNKSVILYGARTFSRTEAEKFLPNFEPFARWAEEQLL